MNQENPEGTQVIVGSMNMGYISDTARNRTHNCFSIRSSGLYSLEDTHTIPIFSTRVTMHISSVNRVLELQSSIRTMGDGMDAAS